MPVTVRIELWTHLESLGSAHEARIAVSRSYRNSYASLVLFKLPTNIHTNPYLYLRTLSMNHLFYRRHL